MNWEIWDGLLQRDFCVSHGGGWNRIEEIGTILIGGHDISAQTNSIYLYTDIHMYMQDAEKGIYPGHCLCIVTPDEISKTEHIPTYYVLAEQGNKEETINSILQLFAEGERWLSKLREAACADRDMQTLVELAGHFWNISVVIVNAAYEIGEHVDMPGQVRFWETACDANGRMTEEAISKLYLDTPQFDETFLAHGLQEYRAMDRGTGAIRISYYYNFMDETDTYTGRILFAGLNEAVSPEIRAAWSYVAQQAEICFKTSGKDMMATRLRRELQHLFLQMLDGENVSQIAVNVALEQKGWKITDDYKVYRFVSNGNMHSHHTLTYYCHMLERSYPELVAVEKDHGICCLCHVEKNPGNFQEQLPYFVREHLFIAGISNTFHDFFSIGLYAGEADCALNMGLRYAGHMWVHKFSEYALRYCMEKMTEEYPADELIASELKILEAYDLEHPGSDMLTTLKEYIQQQFNATHTANRLHIHRTTLLYRLRRIQELTRLSLDSRDTVLHLQLSFALLERRGRNDEK